MALKPFEIFSNAVRAKEIVAVLARNGFADLLQRMDLPPRILSAFGRTTAEKRSQWQRLRHVLEELGPTFVKAGQLLSMRPDIAPEPLIKELRELQERVSETPFEEIKPVIEAGLGAPISEVFATFDEKAAASASMAQVYYATLRETGEAVAVKAQRPGIEKVIEADFDIIEWLTRQAHERVEELRPYNFPAVVETLKNGVERELDFRIEARSQAFFGLMNAYPEETHAPKIYTQLSSRRVIVMEWIEGQRIAEMEPASEEAKALARVGSKSMFNQILINGFFHADPHAGNLRVMPDGRLCFMDWGLSGQLTQRMRYGLVDLFLAFVRGDAEKVAKVGISLADSGSPIDQRKIEREIMVSIRKHYDAGSGKGEVGKAILDLLYIFGQNGIDLARDYSLMAKAILCVEETGKTLDPSFSIRDEFEPALRELMRDRRSPKRLAKEGLETFMTGIERFRSLPDEIHRILRKVEKDSLRINLQHRGLEELDYTISDASNKITLGIIIGCLIVGSSLIVSSGTPPIVMGFPILGVVGYLLSIIFGVWVIWDILRGAPRGKKR